jgi:hypothetical protein
MTWRVDVSQLLELAHRCRWKWESDTLVSAGVTGPLGGVAFGLNLECMWGVAGAEVGLFAQARGHPA